MAQQGQLLAFPEELLRSIFELAEADRPTGDGFANWHRDPESVRTLQSLQLTCRRFREIASPLLLPTINVGFTRSSIERFEKVCSHPFISQGVRVVQVVLNSFDAGKVVIFQSFQWYMSRVIKEALLEKWRYHEVDTQSTWEETLRCEPKLRRARIVFATLRYWEALREALCEPAAAGDDNGTSLFATRLASAMAKMSGKRPRTIEFLDTPRTNVPPLDRMGGLSRKGTDWSRSDFEIFYEPFLRPEENHNSNAPPCTTLYSTLLHIPRALQAANVRIVEDISVDLPHMPLDTSGDRARTLFEALRSLKLKSFSSRSTRTRMYPRDQGYLTTCLAVPTLERISLEGPRYQLQYEFHDWARTHFDDLERGSLSRYMPSLARRVTAAAAIGITSSHDNDSRNWRHDGPVDDPNIVINRNLRCVRLDGGVFELKQLRELLQSLPQGKLDEFSLCHVRLLRDEEIPGHPKELEPNVVGTRSWEKVLDLLREGLTIRGRPGDFRLRRVCTRLSLDYTDLSGLGVDEFAGVWGYAPLSREEEGRLVESIEMGQPEPPSPAEEYVTRLSDVNPIRAQRVREEAAEEDRKE